MLDNIQIYCDLDGVLVEFEQSVIDLMNLDLNAESPRITNRQKIILDKLKEFLYQNNRAYSLNISDLSRNSNTNIRQARDYMYARTADNHEFWADLPWKKDGQVLWNFIKDLSPQVKILSAPMQGAGCRSGKREWVEKNLGPQYDVILEANKWIFAKPNRLLIDDTFSKVAKWRENGGQMVQHITARLTIQSLKGLVV